jgi:DNA-binding CsgD family transcriptional regulator
MGDEAMATALESSLKKGDVAVCIKKSKKRILMQNESCRTVCGDRQGKVCRDGCMEIYGNDTSRQWKGRGSHGYQNSEMHGGFYDVALLCSREHIITFLQPLGERYELALKYYRGKGLTKRETEVMLFTICGSTNSEICRQLSISSSTLRTQLNNIYNKLRDLGEMPEYIPANRRRLV